MTHVITGESDSVTYYWTGDYFNPNPLLALRLTLGDAQRICKRLNERDALLDSEDRMHPKLESSGRL